MSGYRDRIGSLAARAAEDRAAFEPPVNPPDEAAAMEYLREGVGPAVALYVEARTGPGDVRFSEADLSALAGAMNDWLALYCQCYGVDFDPTFTLREAAELLVETHNVRDVAEMLTGVPGREAPGRAENREQN